MKQVHIDALRAQLATLQAINSRTCTWTQLADDLYMTGCDGEAFVNIRPEYKYCTFCGGTILEKKRQEVKDVD